MAWGLLASLSLPVTPGLPFCLAAACGSGSVIGLYGRAAGCSLGQTVAAGPRGTGSWWGDMGGGQEAQLEPGKAGSKGSTPRSGHHQPPVPRLAQG